MDLKDKQKRQEAEKIFHNKKFLSQRKKDYDDLGFKSEMFKVMMNKIGNIEGKRVLEFGCGGGWLTKILVSKGANVWAFDISEEAVRKTRALIGGLNVQDKVSIDQMSGEKLAYNSNMFDFIIGNAILHHIELGAGLREIRRVLKEGGMAIFMEPLGHNPFLNLYRKITPNSRSRDEMPLRFEQFSLIREYFPKFEHKEYYLTSLLALLLCFPGMYTIMLRTRNLLLRMDNVILRSFPCMRKYCWYSILEIEK